MPSSLAAPVARRSFPWWIVFGLISLAIGLLILLGWLLFEDETVGLLPVAIRSQLRANYSSEARAFHVAAINVRIIQEALRDQRPTAAAGQPTPTPVNVQALLRAPVPSVTLAPGQPTPTALPPTARPSATAPPATVTLPSTATDTATSTPMPSDTASPIPTATRRPPTRTPRPLPTVTDTEASGPTATSAAPPTNPPANTQPLAADTQSAPPTSAPPPPPPTSPPGGYVPPPAPTAPPPTAYP